MHCSPQTDSKLAADAVNPELLCTDVDIKSIALNKSLSSSVPDGVAYFHRPASVQGNRSVQDRDAWGHQEGRPKARCNVSRIEPVVGRFLGFKQSAPQNKER